MGRRVPVVIGMIIRVRRHGSGVGMHREGTNVAEDNKHGHGDEQPGRQTPSVHANETSERPASCQACVYRE